MVFLDVRFGPKADTRLVSFDDLVGAAKHRRRHRKAERLRGFEIDYQLELGWRLYRQVGGLLVHLSEIAPYVNLRKSPAREDGRLIASAAGPIAGSIDLRSVTLHPVLGAFDRRLGDGYARRCEAEGDVHIQRCGRLLRSPGQHVLGVVRSADRLSPSA